MTNYIGTAAGDDILGTTGRDTFDMTQGGNDDINGNAGNDLFLFGGTLTGLDFIDGYTGNDTLMLDGDYDAGLVMVDSTFKNIETLKFGKGHNYTITLAAGNVASGQNLHIDGHAVDNLHSVNVDGSAIGVDSGLYFIGGAGGDSFFGGAGANAFDLTRGGADAVMGGAAADTFLVGRDLGLMSLNGQGGRDVLILNSDSYATKKPLILQSYNLSGIEELDLVGGHSYALKLDSQNIAGFGTLTVRSLGFLPTDWLRLDGSAIVDGHLNITAGAGNDTLKGGGNSDTFNLIAGGVDHVDGGGGSVNTFLMGASLTADDVIRGGTSNVGVVTLDGAYDAQIVLGPTTLTNVRTVNLTTGHDYTLILDEATAASGNYFAVDGSGLGSSNNVVVDGSHDSNAHLQLYGGAGEDSLAGGQGADELRGGLSADYLKGNGGADHLLYGGAEESTGFHCDYIDGFSFVGDKFDLDVAVSGIDLQVRKGQLNDATFDADLVDAITPARLAAGHAVLFQPGSGDHMAEEFLIVDANGIAGYQAGADYVFKLIAPSHLGSLDATDFI